MKTHPLKIEVWKARDGWRWRIWRSGQIVAESGESYVRKSGCKRTLFHLIDSLAIRSFKLA